MNTEKDSSILTSSDGDCNLTVADLATDDWEAALTGAEHPVCPLLATKLFQRASELSQTGDERGERVFRFLAMVASPNLSPGEVESPFTGVIVERLSETNLD